MSGDAATPLEAELDRAGLEYRAQAAAADAPVQKAVDKLQAAQAPVAPPNLGHSELAVLFWTAAALLLPKLDKRLVYSAEELDTLAKATVPVLEKYFPGEVLPCELVLAGTVLVLTAPKLLAPPPKDDAGGAAQPEAPAAPTSPPTGGV